MDVFYQPAICCGDPAAQDADHPQLATAFLPAHPPERHCVKQSAAAGLSPALTARVRQPGDHGLAISAVYAWFFNENACMSGPALHITRPWPGPPNFNCSSGNFGRARSTGVSNWPTGRTLSTATMKQLVSDGTLTKLSGGLYDCPKDTVFGKAPADDEELVSAFLRDDRFSADRPQCLQQPRRWHHAALRHDRRLQSQTARRVHSRQPSL